MSRLEKTFLKATPQFGFYDGICQSVMSKLYEKNLKLFRKKTFKIEFYWYFSFMANLT